MPYQGPYGLITTSPLRTQLQAELLAFRLNWGPENGITDPKTGKFLHGLKRLYKKGFLDLTHAPVKHLQKSVTWGRFIDQLYKTRHIAQLGIDEFRRLVVGPAASARSRPRWGRSSPEAA